MVRINPFVKFFVFSLMGAFLLSSCSYKVNRIGYSAPTEEKQTCNVVFQKQGKLPYEGLKKVGEIELKDNGFSSNCNEGDAIKLLKKESCSLGVDLVNIIEEVRTDNKSSCYRCTAELLIIENDSLLNTLQNGSEFDPLSLEKRLTEDKKKNRGKMVGVIIGGLLASSL